MSLLDVASGAPFTPIEALTGSGAVVVLAPHPDDESLGCGGATMAAVSAGHRVVIVGVTDGSKSHPGSHAYPSRRLAELRAAEARAATDILVGTPDAWVPLGYPDCAAPADAAEISRATGRIVAIARDTGASAVWATWGGDPHCDHEATARLAREVARMHSKAMLWSYPVWGRFGAADGVAMPACSRMVRFDTNDQRERKASAVACHKSQMTGFIEDDPDGFVMDAEMQRHFIEDPEIFIREVVR